MTGLERTEAVAYHYSSTYRDIINGAFECAGLTPYVFDEPEEAKSHLNLATKALIVPFERYTLAENGDGLDIERPSMGLLQIAEAYGTPWVLICGPSTEMPHDLLQGAQADSIVLHTGEEPAFSAEERIAIADTPDPGTQARLAHVLSGWLQRIDVS